jgi:hypothetical protein
MSHLQHRLVVKQPAPASSSGGEVVGGIDPCVPVASGGSWAFRFHDHQSPFNDSTVASLPGKEADILASTDTRDNGRTTAQDRRIHRSFFRSREDESKWGILSLELLKKAG